MNLQAFGALLAEEHRRTMSAHEQLVMVLAELEALRRRPDRARSADVNTLDDVLTAARDLRESATIDALPPWFPCTEPTAPRVLRDALPVLLRVAPPVTLVAESPHDGALIRSASFATAMTQLADLVPPSTSPRHQVLRLMASGADDAAMAAATGRSIRTIRAHIAGIMADLGVRTRFAAGVEAARRGWL